MTSAIAILLLALGAIVSLLNWYSLYRSLRFKEFHSSVPLLGGLLLTWGLLSFEKTLPFAWLGLIADYGTIAFAAAIPFLLREAWSTCRLNLVHRFLSEANGRRDDMRLFRGSVLMIRTKYDPPVTCNQYGARIISGGYRGKWTEENGVFLLHSFSGERMIEIRQSDGRFVATERNCPSDGEPRKEFDSLGLRKVK